MATHSPLACEWLSLPSKLSLLLKLSPAPQISLTAVRHHSLLIPSLPVVAVEASNNCFPLSMQYACLRGGLEPKFSSRDPVTGPVLCCCAAAHKASTDSESIGLTAATNISLAASIQAVVRRIRAA